MFVLIFTNKEEAQKAAQLNWEYASWIEETPIEKVIEELDKFV